MMFRPDTEQGFTLIELMITLVILAVLITVGVPNLSEFIAGQRVRTTASDLVADMAFARAEAIKESRPVFFERVSGATNTWKDGWRVCVNLNGDTTCNNNEIRKISPPVPGRTRVCPLTSDFNDRITFRPDGRAGGPANAGLRVSDDNDDGTADNDRVRVVFIGISGRARMEIQEKTHGSAPGAVCP